ncbi:MAG: 2-dehydro-3-deoxyphosphooctonate aldolase [Chlamydiota bacterium]|jgi:2-dehydro-3-deoxyphosphooctonate aldolase (KDO 8-P synthase)
MKIGQFEVGQGQPLAVISGPCVIESEEHAMRSAEALLVICSELNIPLVYKSSYDKANRSSAKSFRGPGIKKGLAILRKVKERFHLPLITDVHSPEEAKEAAQVCDIIQIPAFLCRQTDLIEAAGSTGAIVNVKKGQFLAPWDMKNVVDKLVATGNSKIILTDRGTTFGYNNLVSDMRSIPIMQKWGFPVCFDASHSVQLPGGAGTSSGGQREFIPTLAFASVAAGADLLFIESHPNPAEAKSDKDSVYPLSELKNLLRKAQQIRSIMQEGLC